jgi:hypothetical protein
MATLLGSKPNRRSPESPTRYAVMRSIVQSSCMISASDPWLPAATAAIACQRKRIKQGIRLGSATEASSAADSEKRPPRRGGERPTTALTSPGGMSELTRPQEAEDLQLL